MSSRLILLFAAIGLTPIALSYGVVPSKSVPFLLGFPVEGTNHTHVFRAMMGLYLANVCFYIAGALIPSLRVPALWGLFVFMAGLAAGRFLSLVMDGLPSFVLIFYFLAEVVLAALALLALRRPSQPKTLN